MVGMLTMWLAYKQIHRHATPKIHRSKITMEVVQGFLTVLKPFLSPGWLCELHKQIECDAGDDHGRAQKLPHGKIENNKPKLLAGSAELFIGLTEILDEETNHAIADQVNCQHGTGRPYFIAQIP